MVFLLVCFDCLIGSFGWHADFQAEKQSPLTLFSIRPLL